MVVIGYVIACVTLTARETGTQGEVFVVIIIIIIIITNFPSTDQDAVRRVWLGLIGQHYILVTAVISAIIC